MQGSIVQAHIRRSPVDSDPSGRPVNVIDEHAPDKFDKPAVRGVDYVIVGRCWSIGVGPHATNSFEFRRATNTIGWRHEWQNANSAIRLPDTAPLPALTAPAIRI
jgi:hypothetical protein